MFEILYAYANDFNIHICTTNCTFSCVHRRNVFEEENSQNIQNLSCVILEAYFSIFCIYFFNTSEVIH
jgi:hypothetical protein